MIYAINITTDANTAKSSPKLSKLPVTEGLVYRFELTFPPGSMGLMGLKVFSGNFQIWPSTRDTWFRGDDMTIAFDDIYLVSNEPFVFLIATYNEDDTYEHEALLRLGLVSEDVFMARFLPSYAYEEYKKMLLELQKRQDLQRAEVLKEPFPWLR